MPTKPPDPRLVAIAEVVRAGSVRSPLYVWLKRNHDPFAEMLAEHRPNWAALAEGFAAQGLTRGLMKAETVRHTWLRVRNNIAAAEKARKANAAPKVTVLRVVESPAPPATGEQRDDPLAAFRRELDHRSGRR